MYLGIVETVSGSPKLSGDVIWDRTFDIQLPDVAIQHRRCATRDQQGSVGIIVGVSEQCLVSYLVENCRWYIICLHLHARW